MNDTRHARSPNSTGNGRTPEENREWARLAANSMPRQTQLANAAAARTARTLKLAREIDPAGTMDPADLAREIGRRKAAQLAKARAVRLGALRRARQAAEVVQDATAALAAAEAAAAETA